MLAERFQILQMDMEDIARGTEGNIEKGDVAHPARSDSEDPSKILPIASLVSDVRTLEKLTATKDPLRVQLRVRGYYRPYTFQAMPVKQDSDQGT